MAKIFHLCVAPKERAQANLGNSLAITCNLHPKGHKRLDLKNLSHHRFSPELIIGS